MFLPLDFFADKPLDRAQRVGKLAQIVAAAHGGVGLAATLAAGNGGDIADDVPGLYALCHRVLTADALEGDLVAVGGGDDRDHIAALVTQHVTQLAQGVGVAAFLGAGHDAQTAHVLAALEHLVGAAGGFLGLVLIDEALGLSEFISLLLQLLGQIGGTGLVHGGKGRNLFQITVENLHGLKACAGLNAAHAGGNGALGDDVEGTRLAGHNLIGNPFAEEVGINKEFYIMNAEGTELEAAEREYLNPMEGAFVVATEPEQTVVLGGAGGGGFNPGGSFKVRVSGTRGGDHAIIRFGQGEGLPKFMINPEHTNISFPMEDADYAVAYAENMGEMPVNFKAEKNGSYTMDFSAKNVEFGYLHLIDNKNGNDVDLLANPTYSFDALTTDYATRFKLVFATGNADDSFAFYSNGSFIISNDGNAMLQVVDVTGRILKSESINGCASVNVDAAPGVYMLRLINGDNLKVQKVVVK